MIKRLQRRFLLLSLAALLVLLAVIVLTVNLLNYHSVVRDADEILGFLSRNKGTFPEFEPPEGEHGFRGDRGEPLPPTMSAELPYEARYFSVVLNGAGEVIRTDTSRIAAVKPEAAEKYAAQVQDARADNGFEARFRYCRAADGENTRIIFLDCGRQLDVVGDFALFSTLIALGAYLTVSAVLVICSKRIIRPIAESYEKQKRFITDAGHEIKTPLTVIRANVDILELEIGKNENLTDIREQSEHLAELTRDLVQLSRMEEREHSLPLTDFPVSEIVQEALMPFEAPAKLQGKQIVLEIEPRLSMLGNSKALAQLVGLLMDNALKYAPSESEITVRLCRQSRGVVLSVRNQTEQAFDRAKLSALFDRFYRADSSRNSQTGGYGIGLSIARAIVTAHGGKIQATMPNEGVFEITATFPK